MLMSFSGNMESQYSSSCLIFSSHGKNAYASTKTSMRNNSTRKTTTTRLSDEYEEAFRTMSYKQLTKEARQSRRRSVEEEAAETDDGLHHLVAKFLSTALAALELSGLFLASIDRVKAHSRFLLHRAIRLDHVGAMVTDLTRLGDLIDIRRHGRVHELFDPLIPRLSRAQRKVRKQARILNLCRRTIVPSCMTTTSSWRRKKIRWLAKTRAQLSAAERGAYTLVREFDTLTRMVTRLRNEIEWRRDVLKMVVERSCCKEGGGVMLLREVVVQLQRNEKSFDEQLRELERHVYLFILTVKRSTWLINGCQVPN